MSPRSSSSPSPLTKTVPSRERGRKLTGSEASFVRKLSKRFSKGNILNLVSRIRKRKMQVPFRFLSLPKELRDEVYRLALCNQEPIAPRTEKLHCSGCGFDTIRDKSPLDRTLLWTCKQILDEGSRILYSETTFAIDDSAWPLIPLGLHPPTKWPLCPSYQENPATGIPTTLMANLEHRYTHLIRNLDAQIHIAPLMLLGEGPTIPTGDLLLDTWMNYLELDDMCAWYGSTLDLICSRQGEQFPELQVFRITVKEHGARWQKHRCGDLFVMEVHLNRRAKTCQHYTPQVPVHLPLDRQQLEWAERKRAGRNPPIDSYIWEGGVLGSQDPRRQMLLPLMQLKNVVKVKVQQDWVEKQVVKVGEKTEEVEKAHRRIWQFSAVDEFLNYAGEGFVSFHRPLAPAKAVVSKEES